jgi:hypothetical protein
VTGDTPVVGMMGVAKQRRCQDGGARSDERHHVVLAPANEPAVRRHRVMQIS